VFVTSNVEKSTSRRYDQRPAACHGSPGRSRSNMKMISVSSIRCKRSSRGVYA
jgi:hypothetical protein